MRYECALETCPCGTRCTNRRMRSGSAVSTAVIDYGRKGVGVVALEPIETDEYVGEYVGEVLTSGEATLRAEVCATTRGDRTPRCECTLTAACVTCRNTEMNHTCISCK